MPNNMSNEEIAKYVDLDSGLGRVRGNADLYKRMLGMFTAGEEFDAFEKALAENDLPRATEAIHGIKGVTGNLSLTRVFELSTALNTLLRDGVRDDALIDEYREALEITRACVDEVMTSL